MDMRNHDLKEDIREYWSKRSQTFDLAFGHRIPPGPELDAWAAAMRDALGARPLKVLELACGTGEVTNVLLSLGHEVTALDFSEAMLAVARRKHAGNDRVRFILADAERTMEPDETYDAVVCRHLVWTLTEPEQAFAEWFRLLKPGGRLLVFDGDWSKPTPLGRLASIAVAALEQIIGHDPHYDGAMSERHATIMERLPFGDGLTVERLLPFIEEAGFENIELPSRRPIAAAQRRNADLRNRLRTFFYRRFFLVCSRPSGDAGRR
ncbi:class I SAM-dependent methyltransferase [Sinorhizobium meliloti]|uniref:class I SAM-dependent methyltransferase n=1 Tax=Rhizobium meliloti TaxID=382 RepID=UPI000FDC00A0|nr:methyltransferase domain-containing protein [Sinorhizobium meliloti]RVN37786.1 methyltransferase domain-containing protein [Sinorhizobium meliloti]RVQ25992.1 methyltransferase domain-containing protein [Sinorhizobium meliloti]RVQ35893.1 methyltransferase domain-containing protein [Sinorhizobium meliloti]RVQ63729.1 methyltransferase domain-containing protein [Sinorhizobium meliloti]